MENLATCISIVDGFSFHMCFFMFLCLFIVPLFCYAFIDAFHVWFSFLLHGVFQNFLCFECLPRSEVLKQLVFVVKQTSGKRL